MAATLGIKKAKLWVDGRKNIFSRIEEELKDNTKPVIWFHGASLGEYEMGKPLIDHFNTNEKYMVLLTIFSPSGYEHLKGMNVVDHIFYLPLDLPMNASKFVDIVKPVKAIFIKNEIWLNYIFKLKERNIPLFLISGLFRSEQVFFKSYGSIFRKALNCFDGLFVQDKNSEKLLKNVGVESVEVVGDTRMDRTFQNAQSAEVLPFLNKLKNDKITVVLGSSWEAEEELICNFYKKHEDNISLIIAPHDISEKRISSIQNRFEKVSLLSEMIDSDKAIQNVVLVDTIGHLMKLYKVADIAFVGGAWGSGLHNILEPAAFGVPVIFGPNILHFPEAQEILERKAAYKVRDQLEFDGALNDLVNDEGLRKTMGENAKDMIKQSVGATSKLITYIDR